MDDLEFLNNSMKLQKLNEINKNLGLENIETNYNHNNIIFVYSIQKVGSTSLVSSLKLFVFFGFVVIHIHSEIMLEFFSGTKDITVIELINYNSHFLKRNVCVIDIYRLPIELKISTYFEKIANFHFNTTNEKINTYDVNKIIKRFNLLFPHIAKADIFMDKYNIQEKIQEFDYKNKYIFYEYNNIKYLKLRLQDVYEWRNIFRKIFNIDIVIVKDYVTSDKEFKNIYEEFIKNYKIPNNLLYDEIQNCKYFNYYCSPEERKNYIQKWSLRTSYNDSLFQPMNEMEYKIYEEISIENQIYNFVDTMHYIYNGCVCKGCLSKRQEIINNLLNGSIVSPEKIIHEKANYDLAIKKQNKLKNIVFTIPTKYPTKKQIIKSRWI